MDAAAAELLDAAEMMINLLRDLKPTLISLGNRNYCEIQLSAAAVKQLVGCFKIVV